MGDIDNQAERRAAILDTIKLLNEIADRECYGKGRRVPIIIAAMFNLTVTAMELIRDGVDVNEAGHEDKTALHLAAARGYHRMCGILLEAGADVNAKSNGETPLDFARSLNHSSIVKLLSNWGDDQFVDGD